MTAADAGALARLVVRAQARERDALDALLRALQAPLHRHVRAIVRDADVADDVLQDVLWLVCRKLGRLRDPCWVRAWAYRIATREAVRRSRRAHDWRRDDAALASVEAPAPEGSPDGELLAQLPVLVGALPPASEVVVRLHYLDGLTIAEVAEALELAPGTVKSRLAYGLSALRRRMPLRTG